MKEQQNRDNIPYPVRINRYLALTGYCSRRKADDFIARGSVTINDQPADLGDVVRKGDVVRVGGEVERFAESYEYFAYHKPRGVVSHNPQEGEKGIEDIFRYKVPLYPMGRLDKESRGLMILSNDGRIVDRLLNPRGAHEKEYEVLVDKTIRGAHLAEMEKGVKIEGYRTKPCKATKIDQKTFRIILTEGKKHQIRRMCAALGYQVKDLKRLRIMSITLGTLKPNQARKLSGKELQKFLKELGV